MVDGYAWQTPFDVLTAEEQAVYAQYLIWGIEDWIDAHSEHKITYDFGYGFGV